MTMKRCSKCKQTKPSEDFNRNRSTRDGLHFYCRPCHNCDSKEWNAKNRASYLAIMRRSSAKQLSDPAKRAKLAQQRKTWYYRKLREDPAFRACKNARVRVNNFLSGERGLSHSLGCTQAEFKAYLANQFQPGMTWENYGLWHIDHRYPLSVAHAEGPAVFERACHYTNLQPLWAKDNCAKGDSILIIDGEGDSTSGKPEASD